MDRTADNVDYGLLNRLSDQLVCSRCLRRGIRTRVVQIISARHSPRSLCNNCREQQKAHNGCSTGG
jgi:hypothetical protein